MEKTFSINQTDETTIRVDRNGFADYELIAILRYVIDMTSVRVRVNKTDKVESSVDLDINGWKKVDLNPSE